MKDNDLLSVAISSNQNSGNFRKETFFFLFFLASATFFFLQFYNFYYEKKIEEKISFYGQFIAVPLWNFDKEGLEKYLFLLEQADIFYDLRIDNENDNKFVSIEKNKSIRHSPFEMIGWAKEKEIRQNIYYKQRKIGSLRGKYYKDFTPVIMISLVVIFLCIGVWFFYIRAASLSERLKQSEKKHRTIVENIHDIIMVTDLRGHILYISSSIERLLGIPKLKIMNGHKNFLCDNNLMDFEKFLEQIQKQNQGVLMEYQVQTADGQIKWISHSWKKTNQWQQDNFDNDNTTVVVSLLRDISSLKESQIRQDQMKEQVIQSSKLASLGTIAAGIAHELNNPLAIISGYLQIISKPQDFEGGRMNFSNYYQAMKDAVGRMQAVINHIREFSRDASKVAFEYKNINQVVLDSLLLIGKQMENNNIKIETNLSNDIPKVYINRIKIESVFQNLIINAKDAFIDLKDRVDKRLIISTYQDDKNVIITFKDNASGMSPEVLSRIFDPFFTTKDIGKGTGLGLSISHGIIQEHKGEITARSEKGEGTLFVVKLPILEQAESV